MSDKSRRKHSEQNRWLRLLGSGRWLPSPSSSSCTWVVLGISESSIIWTGLLSIILLLAHSSSCWPTNCESISSLTGLSLHPTVSAAELDQISNFFALHPHIKRLQFQPLSLEKSNFRNNVHPLFAQVEAISNSLHLLDPILAALSPPLSAMISDLQVAGSMSRFASNKSSISTYVLATTSAVYFSLMLLLQKGGVIFQENSHLEIPGFGSVPISSIPPQLLDSNHFLSALLDANIPCLSHAKAILINSCGELESETIEAGLGWLAWGGVGGRRRRSEKN
ncbi:UDP-glycosyltransferase 708C1-like [Henckelia pumila]|uniref:UDP-glycosyltransferase 708C1-like n=1 Tax=Henckelia pumila TaxID=405737 RepID=UPI003C6DB872